MEFVDLRAEYIAFSQCIEKRWKRIKQSGRYLFGDQILELEKRFPKVIGKSYGIAVGSATDALMLTLLHVYKKGMSIIVPNFGAYPTATVCRHITDRLYYVDVDSSMTMDVDKLPDIKNGIIVPVHLFGNNCQMDKIMSYAKSNNHIVIEDCAQSTGSGSGIHGDYSIFSFYPTKPLASMGDGGIICSNNSLDYFRKARVYGVEDDILGFNSRMDEFQAAVVNCKMDSLGMLNAKRIKTAMMYKEVVSGYTVNSTSVYHQFTIRFKNRDKIVKKLDSALIPYMIHYPRHVNEMSVLAGAIPSKVDYRVDDSILSVPIHPYLTDVEVKQIMEFLYGNRKEEITDFH